MRLAVSTSAREERGFGAWERKQSRHTIPFIKNRIGGHSLESIRSKGRKLACHDRNVRQREDMGRCSGTFGFGVGWRDKGTWSSGGDIFGGQELQTT